MPSPEAVTSSILVSKDTNACKFLRMPLAGTHFTSLWWRFLERRGEQVQTLGGQQLLKIGREGTGESNSSLAELWSPWWAMIRRGVHPTWVCAVCRPPQPLHSTAPCMNSSSAPQKQNCHPRWQALVSDKYKAESPSQGSLQSGFENWGDTPQFLKNYTHHKIYLNYFYVYRSVVLRTLTFLSNNLTPSISRTFYLPHLKLYLLHNNFPSPSPSSHWQWPPLCFLLLWVWLL